MATREQQSVPPRPGTGFFGRLFGGTALAEREAATTQRLDAAERLRALCEVGERCPEERPPAPEPERAP